MAAEVSIIIPTVGRPAVLAEVLCALEPQVSGCGAEVEVIVVCDGDDPGTRTLSLSPQTSFPLDWIFLAENRGHSAARNIGAEHARGDLLVFLDDDTIPASGWLQAHRRNHSDRRDDRVVLGLLRHVYAGPPRSNLELFLRDFADKVQFKLETSLSLAQADDGRNLWVGLNASLPRGLFNASGGFDVSLRHVEEDAELATRIHALGAKFVFEPEALVYHNSTKDLVKLHVDRARQFARADLYRMRDKHQQVAQWPVLASLFCSRGAQRLKHRLAWHMPAAASAIGEACRMIGEALGAQVFLRQWVDLTFKTRYWDQVKDEGLSLRDLRKLVE